jgi:hypothetical protein
VVFYYEMFENATIYSKQAQFLVLGTFLGKINSDNSLNVVVDHMTEEPKMNLFKGQHVICFRFFHNVLTFANCFVF